MGLSTAVLMYHEIVDGIPSDSLRRKVQHSYLIPVQSFLEQMAILSSSGYVSVRLADLVRAVRDKASLPEKSIVITFDDGFDGNVRYALPILKRFGFTATFFISTGLIGTRDMMTWDSVRLLSAEGMDIQSHTVSHPLLSVLDPETTRKELVESKQVLERNVGTPVEYMSYPNGDFSPAVIEALKSSGYKAACSSRFGRNSHGTPIYELRRTKVGVDCSAEQFHKLVEGNGVRYHALRAKDIFLSSIRKGIGPVNYRRLYYWAFRLEE